MGPTCSFSPQNGQNISTTTPSVTMVTTAPSAQLRPALGPGNGIFYAMLLPGLFGAVLVTGSRMRLLVLIVVLGSATLWLGSCGGGSSTPSSPGTPAGNYTVTINATTGGARPITASASFTLTVLTVE